MSDETAITIVPSALPSLDVVAQIAGSHALDEYHARSSKETRRRQKFDLALFAQFLQESVHFVPGDLYNDLSAWRNISSDLVSAFKLWQEQRGYALGSINVRLATIKAYCNLAHNAELIPTDAYLRIQSIKGYKSRSAQQIDDERETKRIGLKKAAWVTISPAHAELLKRAPQGLLADRDRLLLCLLLDHALHIGEAALLLTSAIDLQNATLHYKRQKIGIEQTDDLTPDTLDAAMRYLPTIPLEQTMLFDGLTTRALALRVQKYGKQIGIEHFSPHDCRHFYAEDAIRNGSDIKTLRDAGGWKTLGIPERYVGRQKIANKGIKLSALNQG